LEYNDGIISDHRGLYVDLDPQQLFGGNTHDPVASSSRGFTSKNEKKVKKYLDKLEEYCKDHNVCEQIEQLSADAPKLSRKQIKRRYEGINNDITRGMLSAEQKVKPKEFKFKWSPVLDQARYCVRYWRV